MLTSHVVGADEMPGMSLEELPRAIDGRLSITYNVARLHARDRLADVRLPGGDLGAFKHGDLRRGVVQEGLLNLAEPRPVLGEEEHADGVGRRPPIMVARTVTFSAPCLRARSHAFLICFCRSTHLTPGFGWIVTSETMLMLAPSPCVRSRLRPPRFARSPPIGPLAASPAAEGTW